MKKHSISLLIIFILIIAVIYLWNEKKEDSKAYNSLYQVQLAKDINSLTNSLMLNSIPDTLALYSNDFTENELNLFKNSLRNINLELITTSADIKKIEEIDGRDNRFSESIENLYELFLEIQEDAEKIDEDVFFKISELVTEYSMELEGIFYHTPKNGFEGGSDVLEKLKKEIEDLIENDVK